MRRQDLSASQSANQISLLRRGSSCTGNKEKVTTSLSQSCEQGEDMHGEGTVPVFKSSLCRKIALSVSCDTLFFDHPRVGMVNRFQFWEEAPWPPPTLIFAKQKD